MPEEKNVIICSVCKKELNPKVDMFSTINQQIVCWNCTYDNTPEEVIIRADDDKKDSD